jgi:aminoglycoside/choline kinase family phosphotransferase
MPEKTPLPSSTPFDALRSLFEAKFGAPPDRVAPVRAQLGGSSRQIVRLANAEVSAIGILYDVREENVAFLEFSRHFLRHGLPVPEIYAEDLDQNAYLEEDLGDTTLFEFLSENRDGDQLAPSVLVAYRKVVAQLPRFQVEAGVDLNYEVCYPRHSFDEQSIRWDLNYFKYYFLQLAGIPFNEQLLENDFERLTEFLLGADRDYFLFRDFQSRNVMLPDGEPFFLDYQGGRRGALQYDIASLLYDAKADLPPQVREELLEAYLDALAGFIDLDRASFMRHYYAYVYVRIMQAMGAYGFRGFYERKPLFLQSVPFALKNIRWLLHNAELGVELPELTAAFTSTLASDKFQGHQVDGRTLTVRVFSFSFHEGMPVDRTGHGGGFVFDARSLPNPGREAYYRDLTGKDPEVIEYLAPLDSVRDYFTNATSLVDASVGSYQKRSFDNLMVSFGCTGGQHRSVFLAESMARHLRGADGVKVIVKHLGLKKLGK